MRGKGGDRDYAQKRRDDDHGADSREEAPGERAAGLARLRREVRDGLETGVREHRERKGEGNRLPRGRRAEVGSAPEVVGGDEEGEPEHDQDHMGHEREGSDEDRHPVELRPVDETDSRDREDHAHPGDDVPRPAGERPPADRLAEVVGRKERRQRDDDQVVEEEHPAGNKAGGVVERPAHEGGSASRLRERGRTLSVRERDDAEEEPDGEQHPRRETERVERDDAERKIERRGDLAVRDRGERGHVQDALEACQLLGHDHER
jgi:hypothetical protein